MRALVESAVFPDGEGGCCSGGLLLRKREGMMQVGDTLLWKPCCLKVHCSRMVREAAAQEARCSGGPLLRKREGE